jgi:L-lactate utilization protein LutC|tara:strand:- start:24 stop:767 length:744 start_codon:yes stop_codon:yes gene_type:complete
MSGQAEFIALVTASLGRSIIKTPSVDDSTSIFDDSGVAKSYADGAMAEAVRRSVELAGKMAISAENAGWQVHRVANTEDAIDVIADICQQKKAKSVLRSTHDILSEIPIDTALNGSGTTVGITEYTDQEKMECFERSKDDAFQADVGITGVDYAIAETGTVVIHPRKGVSRSVSLAPPTHIAVLKPGQVLESLEELFAMERKDFLNGDLAGSVNLISGPSKTGDIEGTIVTGIHGPLETHLVILENT